jgi:hypothetical protein
MLRRRSTSFVVCGHVNQSAPKWKAQLVRGAPSVCSRSKTTAGWRDPSLNEPALKPSASSTRVRRNAGSLIQSTSCSCGTAATRNWIRVVRCRRSEVRGGLCERLLGADSCPISRRTPHCANKARGERCCGLGHPCTVTQRARNFSRAAKFFTGSIERPSMSHNAPAMNRQ